MLDEHSVCRADVACRAAWAGDLQNSGGGCRVSFKLELLGDELGQQLRRLGDLRLGGELLILPPGPQRGTASLAISASSASREALSSQSPVGFSRGRE